MKNNLYTFIFLFFLSYSVNAQVNVCATDSIKLNAENHQIGILQWEKSFDTEHWEVIHNANDKTYSFNPSESAYYRVANKFPYCDPNYSSVTLILKQPIAKLGEDRIANGDSTYLYGNTSAGAVSSWEIVEGEGGAINTPAQSITKFTGVPGNSYILRYTLTNSCGTSSDLLNLKFVENQYYDKLVIIDDTDNITSTEAEITAGIYKITFADPVPTIVNQTRLVGITGEGFMRKVESVQQNGNYFEMTTSQAKLDEILLNGGMELGEFQHLDKNGGGRISNYKILNNKPKRSDFLNNSFSKGNYYYVVDETVESQFNGVTASSVNNKNEDALINFNFDNTQIFNQDGLNVKLDGGLAFYPNIIGDMEMNYFPVGLKRLHVGMKEAKLDFNAKLTIVAETAGETQPYHFNLFTIRKKFIVVIGTVPFLVQTKTELEGSTKFSAAGKMSYVAEFGNVYKVNAGIIYDQGNWSTYFDDENTTTFNDELIAKGSITGSLDFGPKTYITINGLAGPYIDPKMTSDLTLCASSQNLDFNWGVNFDVGGKVTVGVHAYMFKKELFDKNYTVEDRKLYTEKTPYMLEYIAGNNQKYIAGQALQQPLKVRILSKNGFYSRNVFVTFEAIDGSGNISEETVLTDNNGFAQTTFTPSANGTAKVRAFVKNCELSYINYAPFTFTFTENAQVGCENTSLYAGYSINNNILKPIGYLGVPPYTYSTDLLNFSSSLPLLTMQPNNDYNFAVKDTKGCIAYTSYSNNPNNDPTSCVNSNLSVNLSVFGKSIVATVKGGISPYTYSINGGGFFSTNVFANTIVGENTITVKDANGCIKLSKVLVTASKDDLIAYFETPEVLYAGEPVIFTNLSQNGLYYNWNFGDGTTSVLENPTKTYNTAGNYTVSLTTINGSSQNIFQVTLQVIVNPLIAGCWKQVSGTDGHTLAIKKDGTLWSWGSNNRGQLGIGTLIDKLQPIQVGSDNSWKEISAGQYHSLAIKNNGTLWAWGGNDFGCLGNNTEVDESTPIQILTDSNWESVSAGSFYSIAIKNDGTMWSWGSNEAGQLGIGNKINKFIPTKIGVGNFWKSVSAGGSMTIAVKADNTIWGFGFNKLGSLGLGNNNNLYLSPTQIGNNNDWLKVSVSKDYWNLYPFSVAIKNNGTLYSTGANSSGQLGNGSNTNVSYNFTQIGNDNDWTDIDAGLDHSIALKTSGIIFSWGGNSSGQLGDGTNIDKFSPSVINGIQPVQKITCGSATSHIIHNDGDYYGFGSNVYGSLGNGTTTNSNIPVKVPCPH